MTSMNEQDEVVLTGGFSRLPKGGIINTGMEEVFVPEVWVRRLGLNSGDILSAVPLGKLGDSTLYEFTVEERQGAGRTQPDRISVVGPLLFHGGHWMVYSEEEGELIGLRPGEVRGMRLKEGDLVEVAYMQGDLASARVAWRYEETDLPERGGDIRRKPRAEDGERRLDVADPYLADRTVFVVGADIYKESFKKMFERRGARFLWESGFQGGPGKTVESKVRQADVVVIVTEMMSHRMPAVEGMCGRYRKPFVYAPSKGSTGAIRQCQKALAEKRNPR